MSEFETAIGEEPTARSGRAEEVRQIRFSREDRLPPKLASQKAIALLDFVPLQMLENSSLDFNIMGKPIQFGRQADDPRIELDPNEWSERNNRAFQCSYTDEQMGVRRLTPEKGESPGELFIQNPEFQSYIRGGKGTKLHSVVELAIPRYCPVEANYAMRASTPATSSGLTSIQKLPEVVQLGLLPMRIADALTQTQTENTTVRYIQENTFANLADAVSENGQLPEQQWDLAETDAQVRKIGVVGRVTEELFSDYPAIVNFINTRMAYAVGIKEDNELLNGSGVSPHIKGLLNFAGIQTFGMGADFIYDALYKALVKCRTVAWAIPTAFVVNPIDWQNTRLTKDKNNQYYLGGPGGYAYGVPVPQASQEMLWGLPVIQTNSVAQGTIVVLAKMDGVIYRRIGLLIETTNSDASDFQYNRIALRATTRLALACYRPASFVTLTNVPAPGQ